MPAHTMLNVAFVLNWNRSAVSCDSFILFCFSCMKETKMKQKNMFAISEPTYDHLLMYAKSQKTTKYENPTQFQYSLKTEMKLFPFRFHSFNEFLFYAICLYIDFQFISLKIWETNIECVSLLRSWIKYKRFLSAKCVAYANKVFVWHTIPNGCHKRKMQN